MLVLFHYIANLVDEARERLYAGKMEVHWRFDLVVCGSNFQNRASYTTLYTTYHVLSLSYSRQCIRGVRLVGRHDTVSDIDGTETAR